MWGIVEKIIDEKIYVIFKDRTYKQYININKLDIKENNQVLIIDDVIVDVKEFDEQLYEKIKELENSIRKNNNCN